MIKILWADDEIDLLKPQSFFIEKKGYHVETVTNGHDALDVLEEQNEMRLGTRTVIAQVQEFCDC